MSIDYLSLVIHLRNFQIQPIVIGKRCQSTTWTNRKYINQILIIPNVKAGFKKEYTG